MRVTFFLLSSVQEGKTIKSSSGFSGKGFKFDETEHALANERKKLQKAALGLQDSDDEDGALDVSNLRITVRLLNVDAAVSQCIVAMLIIAISFPD